MCWSVPTSNKRGEREPVALAAAGGKVLREARAEVGCNSVLV